MTATVQKWGNSKGIRISKVLLDALEWEENEEVSLTVDEGKLIITKSQRRKNIKELFEGYAGDYTPSEIDWGEPAGNEVW